MVNNLTEVPLLLPQTSTPNFEMSNNKSLKRNDEIEEKETKMKIVWRNVILMGALNIAGIYGLYLWLFTCKWNTMVFTYVFQYLMSTGVTAGAHRLWAHRSYKANLPLRIILMIGQTTSFQNDIYEWVRDHRVHHKYTETNADPHNALRGFFFSHMGWLLVKKHKDVINKGKTIDLSDLEADPVVRFQRKYYFFMLPILCFIIPAWIPYYFFGEDAWTCFFVGSMSRYTISLHYAWLVNSAAHMWGNKPYDKNIGPTDNAVVSFFANGEGWHNYHHAFPWDYKAAELGKYQLNFTLMFIDFFAKIGWAYDLKTVSQEMIEKRMLRTGDRSTGVINKPKNNNEYHPQGEVWGWGDANMKEEEIHDIKVYNRLRKG